MTHWEIGLIKRALPLYFPSVSSVKTGRDPIEYVRVLNKLVGGTQYLVSAFDVMRCTQKTQDDLASEIGQAIASGTVVLMDSGNYESYWKAPHKRWMPTEFHDALRIVKPTIAFGFDDQEPPIDQKDHLRQLNAQHEADITASSTTVIPIVHGSPDHLMLICPLLVRDQRLAAIAVPERVLGAGIFERKKAVRALREALDKTGEHVMLHLLGTGNPTSIALYANAGADSFDGLEWCQTVVDHETALLHHFSQGDFFKSQTKWGDSDVSYVPRTLAHNLTFYADWMKRLANAIAENDGTAFCRHNISRRIYVQCASEFNWEDV